MGTGGVTQFICLANSRKLTARCVAGVILADGRARRGDWVRPVSDSRTGEVPVPRLADGSEMRLGDVIEFRAGPRVAHRYQPENVRLAAPGWRRLGRVRWSMLAQLAESGPEPWPVGVNSSLGLLDRFPVDEELAVRSSLTVRRVGRLEIAAARNRWSGRIQVRGTFELEGRTLRLVVTDPVIEGSLTTDGASMTIDDALVCLSLGEAYEGNVYKLIAGVLDPQEYQPR